MTVTPAGLAFAGVTEPNPMGTEEMLEMWRGALKKGARDMLDVLVARYPHTLTREALAEAVEMEVTGGTFGTYLSTLRRNGLVEVDGATVAAADTLFLVGRS